MADFDAAEFVDDDFDKSRRNPFHAPAPTPPAAAEPRRAPTREEMDSNLSDMQAKLAKLKSEQAEIERERAVQEETRRRQLEFTTSRQELIRDINRGMQILEETELGLRRDAEQMAKCLNDLKVSLEKLQTIKEESWTQENLNSELSRALGATDHARMEWNSARLKFPVLTGEAMSKREEESANRNKPTPNFLELPLKQQARIGLALTWPIVLVILAVFIAILIKR